MSKPGEYINSVKLSVERLKYWLSFDPVSGKFTWKHSPRSNVAAGDIAGHYPQDGSDGDPVIRIGDCLHKVKHLVILYMTGHWPSGHVACIDGDRANTRPKNLEIRSMSGCCLMRKSGNKGSASGMRGVTKHGKRFCARLMIDGKMHNLGLYDSADAASAAYWEFRNQIGIPSPQDSAQ